VVGTVGKLVANGLDNGEDPKAPFYYAPIPGATAGALAGLVLPEKGDPAMKGMALGAWSGGVASAGAEVFMHALDHPESIAHDTIIGAMTGAIGDGVVRGVVSPDPKLPTVDLSGDLCLVIHEFLHAKFPTVNTAAHFRAVRKYVRERGGLKCIRTYLSAQGLVIGDVWQHEGHDKFIYNRLQVSNEVRD